MKNTLLTLMLAASVFTFVACDKKAGNDKAGDKKTETKAVPFEEIATEAEKIFRGRCAMEVVAASAEKDPSAEIKESLESSQKMLLEMEDAFEKKYADALKQEDTKKKLEALAKQIAEECAEPAK